MIAPSSGAPGGTFLDWFLILGIFFVNLVFAERSFVWLEAGTSVGTVFGSGISAAGVLFLALVFGYGQYSRRRRYWTAVVFFFVPAVVAVVGFLGGVLACIWRLVSSTG
jgi:putative effector of murein hydrolase LrgA (UPF0299 family)